MAALGAGGGLLVCDLPVFAGVWFLFKIAGLVGAVLQMAGPSFLRERICPCMCGNRRRHEPLAPSSSVTPPASAFPSSSESVTLHLRELSPLTSSGILDRRRISLGAESDETARADAPTDMDMQSGPPNESLNKVTAPCPLKTDPVTDGSAGTPQQVESRGGHRGKRKGPTMRD